MGFEPTTTGITIRDSNQLSYAHHPTVSIVLWGALALAACSKTEPAPDPVRAVRRRSAWTLPAAATNTPPKCAPEPNLAWVFAWVARLFGVTLIWAIR